MLRLTRFSAADRRTRFSLAMTFRHTEDKAPPAVGESYMRLLYRCFCPKGGVHFCLGPSLGA